MDVQEVGHRFDFDGQPVGRTAEPERGEHTARMHGDGGAVFLAEREAGLGQRLAVDLFVSQADVVDPVEQPRAGLAQHSLAKLAGRD